MPRSIVISYALLSGDPWEAQSLLNRSRGGVDLGEKGGWEEVGETIMGITYERRI